METNEFSFEALFNSCDFCFDESLGYKKERAKLNDILEAEIRGNDLRNSLENSAMSCIYEARTDAFKQGFGFAVRSIKFLLKV